MVKQKQNYTKMIKCTSTTTKRPDPWQQLQKRTAI